MSPYNLSFNCRSQGKMLHKVWKRNKIIIDYPKINSKMKKCIIEK